MGVGAYTGMPKIYGFNEVTESEDNKMRRKYLDDLNVTDRADLWLPDDKRQPKWEKERAEYGFDEREIWNLNYTFYCWLYERLKMFIERACTNLNYHTFEYKGETLTQKQCIDKMLEGLEVVLTKEYNFTEEDLIKINDITQIWAMVIHCMWM